MKMVKDEIAGPSDAVQNKDLTMFLKQLIYLQLLKMKDRSNVFLGKTKDQREIEQKKIAFSLDQMSSLIREGSVKSLPIILKEMLMVLLKL